MRPHNLLGAVGGAALLVACSGPERNAEEAGASAAIPSNSSAAAVANASSTSASPSDVAGVGNGLTANVSPLTGSESALSVSVTDHATIVTLPADILFEFDQAMLAPAAEQGLHRAADLIRQGAAGAVTVVGHTDSKGSDAYNDELSQRRARAVADWFAGQPGVRHREYRTVGRGEREPVSTNTHPDGRDNPEGRSKNRRVEVVIPR